MLSNVRKLRPQVAHFGHQRSRALFFGNGAAKSVLLHKSFSHAKADYIITGDKGLLANDVASAITPMEYVEMKGKGR